MADNIILNLGSGGDLLAADDDGTAKHQQVKDSTSLLLKAADYLEGFK